MEKDWARLGSELRAARVASGRTQGELGASIGVVRNSIATVEQGGARRITSTIRSYAREVGWLDGSVESVLVGGSPVLPAAPAPSATGSPPGPPEPTELELAIARQLVARLSPRVLQELADGHVIDTDVLDLREDGSVAVMALVIERGEEPPAPAQVRDDLQEWSRVQRDMRRAVTDRQQRSVEHSTDQPSQR